MSTHKYFDKLCVAVIILAVLLTIVFMNGSKLGLKSIVDEDAEGAAVTSVFTANDEKGDWYSENAVQITLDKDNGRVSGTGAYFLDGDLVIVQEGYYCLTGSLEGSIVVKANRKAKVWIALNGVDINCEDSACLQIKKADKVFLTLAEGSCNSFASGAEYSREASEAGVNGCIYAEDDLTINGSGTLKITAGGSHGIAANDDLVITGGTLDISSASDGIHVNEHFKYENASLTVNAADDAIHSDRDIVIYSGSVLLASCYEGLEAPEIEINGGDIVIYPSDDGINAYGGSNDFGNFGGFGGGFGNMGGFGGKQGQSSDSSFAGGPEERPDRDFGGGFNGSFEGKPDQNFDGSFDGNFDGEFNQNFGGFGGNFEGSFAGNSDGEMPMNPGSAEETSIDETLPTITINGGKITIVNTNGMDADGLDSNGNIFINGGTLFISMTGNGANNAIDYGTESGGKCIISGGTVIAAGGTALVEEISDSSTQSSVILGISGAANSTFSLKQADGTLLLETAFPCSFSAVTFSCPEMQVGETYTVSVGDRETTVTPDKINAMINVSANSFGR